MWEPTTCEDPDDCVDGSTREAECTDEEGANGLPQVRDFTCVDGAWEKGQCRDSELCVPGDEEIVVCGIDGNYSGEAQRSCREDGTWESSACWQQARFIHEAPYGILIRADNKDLLTVGDNTHRTAGALTLTETEYLYPTKTDAVDANERQQRFSASTSHQCGINQNGTAFCWGDNTHGQLGFDGGADGASAAPVSVSISGKLMQAVSVGEGFSCGLTEDQQVYCWGRNDRQQLGRNIENASSATPVKVLDGVRAITAGDEHVCALKGDEVYCWGANDAHQASDSDDTTIASPTRNNTLSSDPGLNQAPADIRSCSPSLERSEISGLAAGHAHTLVSWKTIWREKEPFLVAALGCSDSQSYQTNFNLVAVGSNSHGQSGTSSSFWSLVSSERESNRTYIPRAMSNVSCLRREQTGEATEYLCAGDNSEGQLSDVDSNVTQLTPIPSDLAAGEVISELAIGFDSMCVLLRDSKRIRCRGGNGYGQLGDGTKDSRRESGFMIHKVHAGSF